MNNLSFDTLAAVLCKPQVFTEQLFPTIHRHIQLAQNERQSIIPLLVLWLYLVLNTENK